MVDEKIIEKDIIHKTKIVDKEKASVYIRKYNVRSMTDFDDTTIEVKDDTSEKPVFVGDGWHWQDDASVAASKGIKRRLLYQQRDIPEI